MAIVTIPQSHWETPFIQDWRNYIDYWERQLRKHLEDEPDPQRRFSNFLNDRASGSRSGGPKLMFFEQPYLMWAEQIETIINTTEQNMRKQIAAEIEHGPQWD